MLALRYAQDREGFGDQILRTRIPGGAPEGAKEVENTTRTPATLNHSIAPASATFTMGRGEKAFVSRAEGRRLMQQR
jgi:hypothetical protein